MRRADIARDSAVTGGADYLFTLLYVSEGSACCGVHGFARNEQGTPPRPCGLSRYGVKLQRADFPRDYPRRLSLGLPRY